MIQAVGSVPAGHLALRVLGGVFFLLGLVGIVLPLLPTVVFWILAAVCWTRSAPGWRRRLTAHPRYGAAISGYLDHRIIPRRAKWYALGAILVSGVISSLALGGPPWLLGGLWALLAGVGVWIATRPEFPGQRRVDG